MRIFAFAALLLTSVAAQADRDPFFRFDGPDRKAWQEGEVQLPPPPREERLVPIFVSKAVPHEYFVDRDSVSIGGDGVVRYTLVMRAAGGARNVSYEGLRCGVAELKVYAYGGADGSWTPLRAPKWRNVKAGATTSIHVILYYDFFCPDHVPPGNVQEAVSGLLRGKHWRAGAGLVPED